LVLRFPSFHFAGLLGCDSRRGVCQRALGLGGSFSGDVIFGLVWSSVLRGCCEMDKKFLVESKSFAFSVLAGASALRMEEKRKNFMGVVILNSQSSEWLASLLEGLLGLPEEQEIVKLFREGSKLLIARRGENKDGCFLEVSSFGLGGRKGFIVIPEGRVGWGWIKLSDELRKVVVFLFGPVGSGSGSSSSSEKKEVKVVQPSMGLAPKWTGPFFVEVLRSVPAIAAKELSIVGGGRSRSRASLPEPCELDLLPMEWRAESVQRSAVDCFSVESHQLNLLDKDRPLRPLGKKRPSCSNLNIERSRLRTWRKLGTGFFLALGRAVRNLLDRFARSGLSRKSSSFCVARLMPKAKVSRPSSSPSETTSKVSSGLILVRSPPRGLEVAASVATEGAGPAISVFVGGSIRSEPSSSAVTGTTSFMPPTGGEWSNVHTVLSSQTPASKESSEGMGMVSSGSFGFCHPPPPAPELLLLVAPAASLGSVSLLVSFELNSSPVSSSLVPAVPSVQAHTASSLHVSADPVEEKKSAEDPSRISELSTDSTLGEKVRDAIH
jgi:hypothetical protein